MLAASGTAAESDSKEVHSLQFTKINMNNSSLDSLFLTELAIFASELAILLAIFASELAIFPPKVATFPSEVATFELCPLIKSKLFCGNRYLIRSKLFAIIPNFSVNFAFVSSDKYSLKSDMSLTSIIFLLIHSLIPSLFDDEVQFFFGETVMREELCLSRQWWAYHFSFARFISFITNCFNSSISGR